MESGRLIDSDDGVGERISSQRTRVRKRILQFIINRKRLFIELIGCSGFLISLFLAMSGLAFLLTLVPVGGFTDAPAVANTLYASLAYQFPSVRKFLAEVPPPPPPLQASMDLAHSPPPPILL